MLKFLTIPTFLATLVLLTWLSVPHYEKIIEEDLKQKVTSVANKHFKQAADIEKLNISLDGQKLSLNLSHLPEDKSVAFTEEINEIIGIYTPRNVTKPRQSPISQPSDISEEQISQSVNYVQPTAHSVKSPYFIITEDDRKNITSIEGEIASTNEKQEIIETLTKQIPSLQGHRFINDQFIVSKEVTTIRQRHSIFKLCAQFLTKAKSATLSWNLNQIKLSGVMKTDADIVAAVATFENLSLTDSEIIATDLCIAKTPSLEFTLERLSNNTIILKGSLPNKAMGDSLYRIVESAHTSTIAATKKTYIANNIRYTDQDIDAWWLGRPELFIGDFLKQTEGIAKIEYTGKGLYIEGIYLKQKDFIRARSSFQSIPDQVDVYDEFLRVRLEDEEIDDPSTNH